MKARITFLLTFLIGLLAFLNPFSVLAEHKHRDSIPESAYAYGYPYPSALGIHVGTTGVGLHFHKPLGNKFGLRVGTSFMPFDTEIHGTYGGRKTKSKVLAKTNNASLLFGWTPFVSTTGFFRSFNFQAGAAYFFKLNGKLKTTLADPYKHGNITVDPGHVGEITTHIQWKESISPYLGIGWSNIILDSRFSINIDLGTYYLSKPKVEMEATGLLQENINNAATIERNIKNYRYLPRVEVGIGYRFW